MVISRRHFIQKLKWLAFASVVPSISHSYPLPVLLGEPAPDYTQQYLKRFFQWYRQTFFNFNFFLNVDEKKLIRIWLAKKPDWGFYTKDGSFVESVLVRHQISPKKKYHGYLSIGHSNWTPQDFKLLNNVLVSKGLPALTNKLQEHFYGINWNFDQQKIKLYFHAQSSHLFQTHEYDKSRKLNQGVITTVKKPPREAFGSLNPNVGLGGFKVTDANTNVRWKIRTRSTFIPFLPTGSFRITTNHKKEFHQLPDLLDVSQNGEAKLYYP